MMDNTYNQSRAMLRVSIVVPTHYRAALLYKVLASLAAQTYPHELLEIIVVASPKDEAFRVVAELSPTMTPGLRCVSIPEDPYAGRSPAAKRNYGVQLAIGSWIAFIDDDCIAAPAWVAGAAALFEAEQVGGVEGKKIIPPTDPPTLTYKGLLLLARPGGYQTCNMFYRRAAFLRVGGFDTHFPFYLEDTDLAWSVLDAGYRIPVSEMAVVTHPVIDPEPWRLLANARRTVLLPYLYRKHPARYRSSGIRVVRWSHVVYLALYTAVAVCLLRGSLEMAATIVGLLILLIVGHLWKLFRRCRVEPHEVAVTGMLLPVVPVVQLVQLVRGNWRYGVWLWR